MPYFVSLEIRYCRGARPIADRKAGRRRMPGPVGDMPDPYGEASPEVGRRGPKRCPSVMIGTAASVEIANRTAICRVGARGGIAHQ